MALKAPQASPKAGTRRSAPIIDVRKLDPFATQPSDIEKYFNENNLDPLGGLPTRDKPLPRRRRLVAEGPSETMSDAPPQALRNDGSGNMVPFTPEPLPLPTQKNTAEPPPVDMLDKAFLTVAKLADAFGLADPNLKLYTDVVARGNKTPITEKNLSQGSIDTLRKVVDTKRAARPGPSGSIGTEDYRNAGVDDKGLLGMFDYDVDDEGNITARDTYDFNLSELGPRAFDTSATNRIKEMFTNPVSYAGYVGTKTNPNLPGRGVPVNINLGNTGNNMDPNMLPGGATIPSAQPRATPSNAQMKFDQGVPAPFSPDFMEQGWHGMWNAINDLIRGVTFGGAGAQNTTTIPKPPMPLEMEPPMPSMNPMFHSMARADPAQAIVDDFQRMPYAMQPAAPPAFYGGGETPSVPDLEPPVPTKKSDADKPKKVEAKENTKAKRKSSPPVPSRNPRRAA
jgi:hypothetical protein